jgi:hypothetical protein
MIKYKCQIHYKDSNKEIHGGMSIEASEVKSPDEFREYIKIAQEAANRTVSSCDIKALDISENTSVVASPQSSNSNRKASYNPKPASEKQIATAISICKKLGESPEKVAKQYGASRLEDMSGKHIWEFINKNQ